MDKEKLDSLTLLVLLPGVWVTDTLLQRSWPMPPDPTPRESASPLAKAWFYAVSIAVDVAIVAGVLLALWLVFVAVAGLT